MKTEEKKVRLSRHCEVEIYRDGTYSGMGMFMKRGGIASGGPHVTRKVSRIINERGTIEAVPTDWLKAVGGAS